MWKRRGGFSVRVKTKASQKEEKPLTGSRGFQRAYRAWGAEIADWQGDGFVVKRFRIQERYYNIILHTSFCFRLVHCNTAIFQRSGN